MIPYTEDKHIEPLLKLCKSIKVDESLLLNKNVQNQTNLIEIFEKKLFTKFVENDFDTSLFQKHLKHINPSSTNLNELYGKWAWFPDISIQLGFQEAFGIIYGIRDTHSWQGVTYFVKRPHIQSLLQISNSSVLLFDIESDFYKLKIENPEEQELLNLLNIFCEFYHNEKWNIGKLISFDSKFVTFNNELNEEISIPVKEYKERTRNFVEHIEDLSFAVITKRN